MLDAQTLIHPGLSHHVISIRRIFLYIGLMIPFLLFQRTRICLLITYLFTYYLAFLIYWGELIASAGTLVPFFLYMFFGLAIVVLFVAASLYEKARKDAEPEHRPG